VVSTTEPSTKILIAEDEAIIRLDLKEMLEEEGFRVVGEASDGEAAIRLAQERDPDVVIMDIKMPGLDGIEASRRLRAQGFEPAILILTMFEDDDSVFAALRAGASGYVLKDANQEDLVRAIRTVASGEVIFGGGVARKVLRYFAIGSKGAAEPFPELTDREREILELVATGANNASIARRLFLSEKTVRNNVSNIFTKLHVADRSEAIVKAREAGLGTGSEPDGPA
jgi:DNA-binding NarL/FixJ family response regulator